MERRKDLDFAKGIGIILMVLGHCYSEGNGGALKIWFYSFHMPLFFLVSGMLAQSKERIPFRRFLCKWARSLLLPYFIWGIAAALYLSIMGRRSLDYFLGCLMQVATLQGLSAMWFLPCLFFAEILFYIGRVLYERNRDLGWGGIVLVSAIGFFALRQTNISKSSFVRAQGFSSSGWGGFLRNPLASSENPIFG